MVNNASPPNNGPRRIRVRPAGDRSPLSFVTLGARCALLGVLTICVVVSCRTTKASEARHTTPQNGQVSYEAVTVPDDSSLALVPEVDYIPAGPASDNPAPAYPKCLLALGLPPQDVVMRILIDDQGQVTAVQASTVSSQGDPVYRADFEAAIAEAVLTWQFTPAMRRRYVDSADRDAKGRPLYRVLNSVTPAPAYFDIRFTFEIRSGKGVVTKQ